MTEFLLIGGDIETHLLIGFDFLFSENKEAVQDMLKDNGIETQFAVAEFIVTMGMFLIMFGEHLVMALQHHHGEMDASFNSVSPESTDDERQKLIDQHHSGDEGHDHHRQHHENQGYKNGMLL